MNVHSRMGDKMQPPILRGFQRFHYNYRSLIHRVQPSVYNAIFITKHKLQKESQYFDQKKIKMN